MCLNEGTSPRTARAPMLEPLEHRRLFSGQLSLSIADVTITEGNGGTANAVVTVSLSAASRRTVAVDFRTEDATAWAGSDYQAVSGRLSFAPGQRQKTITIPLIGDRNWELDEQFVVRLQNASRARIADDRAVVTIADDEPEISISDAWVDEGFCRCNGPTPVTFTVSLAAPYDVPVVVNYGTVDDTATVADGDYDAASGPLTFAPGETSKTVTVSAWGDTAIEAHESFYVQLSGASPFAMLYDPLGMGVIADDDGGVTEPPPDPGCTPDNPQYPNC